MPTDKDFAEDFLLTYNFDNDSYMFLHKVTAFKIYQDFMPKTFLDIGCGIGCTLIPMLEMKVDAWGIEPNMFLVDYFKKEAPSRYDVDKSRILCCGAEEWHSRTIYDVIFCCEVMEHMTDDKIQKMFENIRGNIFIFSSTSAKTTPEQDLEWGHINLKSQEEWIKLFRENGYDFVMNYDRPTAWTKVFKRTICQK